MSSINIVCDACHSITCSDPRISLAQTVYQPWALPSTRPDQQMRTTLYCPRRKVRVKFKLTKRGYLNTLQNTILISATTVFNLIRLILIIKNQTL